MQKESLEGCFLLLLFLFNPKAISNSWFGLSLPYLLNMLNFGFLSYAFLIFPASSKIEPSEFLKC